MVLQAAVAEAQFRRALALNQKDPEAAFNLAVLLASRYPDKLGEARKWYQTAKQLGAQAGPGLDAPFARPRTESHGIGRPATALEGEQSREPCVLGSASGA